MTIKISGIDVPYFARYLPPKGFLDFDRACHALFYYYLLAHKNYENEKGTGALYYEGEVEP